MRAPYRWTIAVLAAATIGSAVGAAPAAAQSPGCPAYLFIGVRGSGEPQSTMGKAVETEYADLNGKVGAAAGLGSHNLVYDATAVVHDYSVLGRKFTFLDFAATKYVSSVAGGVRSLARKVAGCPASRLILAGHSQGAHVVMLWLLSASAADRARVVAVTLFGDPMFHADAYATRGSFDPSRNGLAALPDISPYPSEFKGRLFDFCHAHDPVCQGFFHCFRSSVFTVHCDVDISANTHSTYDQDASLQAAATTARLIRDDLAAHGVAAPEPPPSSKGPVDVAFAIDTTGSMSDIIDSVRDQVQGMATQIAAVQPDYRLALVAYRDALPACEDDFQAQTVQDFTSDANAFRTAVDSLVADGGCDTPESVFTAAIHGVGLGWRPGATRVEILVGDAPGHDVDPGTGFRAADVIGRAQAASVAIYGLDGDDASGTFAPLAAATGGKVFATSESSQVPAAIQQAISAQAAAPSAGAGGFGGTVSTAGGGGGGGGGSGWALRPRARTAQAPPTTAPDGYAGAVGEPVALSAGTSWSPLGRALTYNWDFESDGVYDLTTDVPVVRHVWPAPFDGQVTLQVTDSAGQSAVTRTHVAVGVAPLLVEPGRPSRPKLAKHGKNGLRITWRASRAGGVATAFVVRDDRGAVIAYVAPRPQAVQSLVIKRLKEKRVGYRVRVSALNQAGESPVSSRSQTIKAKKRRARHR